MAEEGIDVPSPSKLGICLRVTKDTGKVNRLLKLIGEFCLHFDGKRIDQREYKVICLKNCTRTLNLLVLSYKKESAEDIFIPMQSLLDK